VGEALAALAAMLAQLVLLVFLVEVAPRPRAHQRLVLLLLWVPTCADDGTVTMTLRQINQDGAGPFTADVDGTSGGVSFHLSTFDIQY
jgi:hypothetical protein